MDAQTLAQAMGNRQGVDYVALVGPCNEAMLVADVTTFLRAVMWCAQIGHESGGLQWMNEIADGAAYEWRKDLGNVYAGDGKRYKGRGPIQLTGRDNYRRFSQWAHQRGLVNSPTYFEDYPLEVSVPRWGFMAAAFFWSTNNINRFAEGREVTNATRVINGGTNGLQDRIDRYNQCFPLGDALLPTNRESEPMGEVADAVKTQLVGQDGKGFPILGVAEETDPKRNRYLTEAVAVILEQLAGPTVDGKSFGGWAQLGDHLKEKRTLVDGIGRVIEQNNEIINLLKGGK